MTTTTAQAAAFSTAGDPPYTFPYTDENEALRSSFIQSLYYNERNRQLAVFFHSGSVSVYDDVAPEEYADSILSDSVGSWYTSVIKYYKNSTWSTKNSDDIGVVDVFWEEQEEEDSLNSTIFVPDAPTKSYKIKFSVSGDILVPANSLVEAVCRFSLDHPDVNIVAAEEATGEPAS